MATSNARQLTPGWRVVTAAATGAHHVATGLPYEDAVGVRPAASRDHDEPSVAVAVADGHGHARHFRSERGSQLAVEIATELGRALAAEVSGVTDPKAVDKTLRTRVGPELVRTWRRAVEQDLKDSPVSPGELSAAGLTARATVDELVYGYGATLMVAVTAGPWLLCLQIGDGDLFAITDTGTVIRPLPADPRLDGSRTTSLCQPDALESMRYAAVKFAEASIGAVMLATDGYGNAQVRNDWEVAFGADLAALTAEHGQGWVAEQLPKWVARCASSEGSGDDVTVALLFATDTTWRRPTRPAKKVAATGTAAAATVPNLASLPPTGRAGVPVSDAPTVRVWPPASPSTAPQAIAAVRTPAVVPAPTPATPTSATPTSATPTRTRHRGIVIMLSALLAAAAIGLVGLILLASK